MLVCLCMSWFSSTRASIWIASILKPENLKMCNVRLTGQSWGNLLQVLHGFFIADYKPRMILYAAFAQTAFFMYLFGSFFRWGTALKTDRSGFSREVFSFSYTCLPLHWKENRKSIIRRTLSQTKDFQWPPGFIVKHLIGSRGKGFDSLLAVQEVVCFKEAEVKQSYKGEYTWYQYTLSQPQTDHRDIWET